MVWYRLLPDWRVVTLPVFVVLAFVAALGAGLWISALNVTYRDFRLYDSVHGSIWLVGMSRL